MIEVFKTNVIRKADAAQLIQYLSQELPDCQCNFDLEDCDRILRVDSNEDVSAKVLTILKQYHFTCQIL